MKKLGYYGSLFLLGVLSVLATRAAVARPGVAATAAVAPADDPTEGCYFYSLAKSGCDTTGCGTVSYIDPSGVAYTVYECDDGMGGEFYCFPPSVPLPGIGTTITIVDTWVLNGCTYTRTVKFEVGSPDDGASIDFCAPRANVAVTKNCPNCPG